MPATTPPFSPLTPPVSRAWTWDVFCRVIDNHGDLGVCWRLARQLAEADQIVRLWCDDASALRWMAPEGCPGVTVLPWRDPTPLETPGDVVIEAFGCDPPAAFVAGMVQRQPAPVWINLEYLSAESYVERSHGLASPQFSGPGTGLTKWFFYPGFTARTGGLLREPELLRERSACDAATVLKELGLGRRAGERLVSVFAYDARPLARLLPVLNGKPVHVLACPGPAQAEVLALARLPQVRVTAVPWLTQARYDDLLRSCDLNIVRGEDSFVRAQWSGRPFVWQIYPQADGAHADKLEAFLARHLAGADSPLADNVSVWHHELNGVNPGARPRLPDWPGWTQACHRWRAALYEQADLVSQLRQFVQAKAMWAGVTPSG